MDYTIPDGYADVLREVLDAALRERRLPEHHGEATALGLCSRPEGLS